ncbi:MAG: glycosyltransferase family 2 protein, partial [Sphingobacteriaceae bacterium]
MLVSIIIVNYNTFTITCNCIRSVKEHTRDVSYEIILVDNASTKDNADEFLEVFPDIKLVKSPYNGGFANGNNLGVEHARGDVILLLNSDTILTEDSISTCSKFLQQDDSLGAISPSLVYEDGKYQHNARAFRSLRNEFLDVLRPFLMFMPYRKRAVLMLNQYFNGDFDTSCDWVSGAFFMFRKSLLGLLPGKKLDERFFMYGEDQLWCYQFQQLGYRSFFVSETSVIHIANASTEPDKQLKLLNTLLQRELEIMRYRKGKGIYYFLFAFLLTIKEKARYY